MQLNDIEVGHKYRCEYRGATYFATVVDKTDKDVSVTLGDMVNADGDPGDPTEALGTLGEVRVSADALQPL